MRHPEANLNFHHKARLIMLAIIQDFFCKFFKKSPIVHLVLMNSVMSAVDFKH